MANPEHVDILKQGVKFWNEWREENPEVVPDLSEANFEGANLRQADFQVANLQEANFQRANLQAVKLLGADLNSVNLNKANLKRADLGHASLRYASLKRVNLQSANLIGANLQQSNLEGADFHLALLSYTQFDDVALSKCLHLETCQHNERSDISTSTFEKSKGQIPIEFLRGCGLSDWEIESAKLYQPGLSNEEVTDLIYKIHEIRTTQAIQINPLFISYSHEDGQFIDKMGQQLTKKGIRFWRDTDHGTAGRIDKQIDRAIHNHSVALLVLSRHSTQSDWVEYEVAKAQILSKALGGKDVLCPIALDDSWKDSNWSGQLLSQIAKYKVVDFSEWKDEKKFDGKFAKLLQGLDLFYK